MRRAAVAGLFALALAVAPAIADTPSNCAALIAQADKDVGKTKDELRNAEIMLAAAINLQKKGGAMDQAVHDWTARVERAKQALAQAVANRSMVGARCAGK